MKRSLYATTLLGAILLAAATSTTSLRAGPYGAPMPPPAPPPMQPTYAPPGGWFFGANVDYLWFEDLDLDGGTIQYTDSWGALGTVGYDFGNNFALDLTTGYLRGELDGAYVGNRRIGINADHHIVPITVNAQYNLPVSDTFGLYFGGGLGTMWNELNLDSIQAIGVNADANEWDFLWQARLGLDFDINPTTSFNVGYRYMNGASGLEPKIHGAEVGVTFRY